MTQEEIKERLKEKIPEFAKKIAPLYQELNWDWCDEGVPTTINIAETLRSLIDSLDITDTKEAQEIITGGLTVYWRKPTEFASGQFGIRFTVEEIEYYL